MSPRNDRYDAIIIGVGQAGNPLARAWAGVGRRVALVEREHVGGSCVNYGCTPTKTMVASARVAYLARRAGDYGVATGEVSVDLAKVRQRKRSIVEEFRGGIRQNLESTEGIDLLFGHARLTGRRSVEVELDGGGRRQLTAEQIFLNTGTRPRLPPIDGLAEVPTLDNTTVMELGETPEHLVILGGGYIGLEFGQMFRRFGSAVTILQMGEQLLGREDPDVAEAVQEILVEDGIEVVLQARTKSARQKGKEIALEVETPEGSRQISGSHLLVAAGRAPNSDDLGLETAGVETDERGYVRVDERLETSVPGIWALGDVKGGPAFTHISYDDFRVIRSNLLEGGDANIRGRLVPYVLFTDPQLGRVGLGEEEAKKQAEEQGWEIRVAKLPMSHVARALEMDETRGFMKAVVDEKSRQILGCAVLGVEGGEVMAVLETAMLGKIPYPVIKEAIFAHPTLAESLNNLFMKLD